MIGLCVCKLADKKNLNAKGGFKMRFHLLKRKVCTIKKTAN